MNKEDMVAEIGHAVDLSPDAVGWRSAPRRAWIEAVYREVVGEPDGRMSKKEMLAALSREFGLDVEDGVAGETSLYPSKRLVALIHGEVDG